jgi:hypothetical protein
VVAVNKPASIPVSPLRLLCTYISDSSGFGLLSLL